MKIYVRIKQLGKIKDTIWRREYDLPFEGEVSLRKFITCFVIEKLKNSGKISFGANYYKNYTDNEAVKIAIESYEDGLYRVFQWNDEIKNLDEIILFHQNVSLHL